MLLVAFGDVVLHNGFTLLSPSAFAVLVDILDRHGGIVNKFLGDGFLALFGAPFEAHDAAHRAVAAAREMLDANERANGASSWPLRIGIGIHVGEVVAGNIGSPRRKEYTVIGDTVNLASRLEQANKLYGTRILVSAETRRLMNKALAFREIDSLRVAGKHEPIGVYELLGHRADMAPGWGDLLSGQRLAHYLDRPFAGGEQPGHEA